MTIGLTWRRTARRIKRLKETVSIISPDYLDRSTPDFLLHSTHDDVLEPQDFGRTIFVNTGDSRGGWHDISPSKRQRSSFACSQSGANVTWHLVEDGRGRCDLSQGARPAAAASKA